MKPKLIAATVFSATLLLSFVSLRLAGQSTAHSVHLSIGDSAPEFSLEDQDRKSVSLHDFHGKNVIIAFYVFSFSPEANQELKSLKKQSDEMNGKVQVLAVSVDSVPVNHAFAEAVDVKFPLLSDRTMEVGKLYGAYSASGISDENYKDSIAAWLIDASGRIASEQKRGSSPNFADILRK